MLNVFIILDEIDLMSVCGIDLLIYASDRMNFPKLRPLA